MLEIKYKIGRNRGKSKEESRTLTRSLPFLANFSQEIHRCFLSMHATAHDTHAHRRHREHFSFLSGTLRTLPPSTYISLFPFLSSESSLFSIARETEQRATGPWLRGYSRGADRGVYRAGLWSPLWLSLSPFLFTCTYYHALAPPPGTEGEINERKVRRERS